MFRTASLFALVLVLAACSKEDDPAPSTPSSPGGNEPPAFDLTVNGAYGVQMTLNGTVITLVENEELGVFAFQDGVENTPPALSTRWYAAGLQNADLVQDRFRIAIGTLEFEGVEVIPDALYAFLAPGPRTYGPATTGLDGVELTYTDGSGQAWSTLCGSAAQTASTFEIIDILQGYDKLGAKATIAATFSCTLYNCTTGSALPVTDGGLVFELREF